MTKKTVPFAVDSAELQKTLEFCREHGLTNFELICAELTALRIAYVEQSRVIARLKSTSSEQYRLSSCNTFTFGDSDAAPKP